MVTEDLAQKVNRPYLRTPRHKIIRAACLVQQKRQEFLASVARGVAPADSPDAPRRRYNLYTIETLPAEPPGPGLSVH